MPKQKLIIVESPAKCKTISKILGSGYKIIATMGHIRDLPKSKMGIDVANNFEPSYQISTDKKQVVKNLIESINKADEVFIATDEDREGEAIGWHVVEAAKLKTNFKRITFHEITPVAIKNAVKNPRDFNYNLVDAQQARRVLDRLVGYSLSPLLAKKILSGLSAGRVQSSALKIIVDREKEIQNFKTEEYWTIDAICNKDEIKFTANFIEKNGKNYNNKSLKTNDDVQKILKNIDKNNFVIKDIVKKDRLKKPNPPFITSTLQQAASKILNFPSKKTMSVAQTLYEGVDIDNEHVGLITYMRTDSTSISKEILGSTRDFIKNVYGDKFLPKSPNIYKTKDKNAQEAHECIRPTYIEKTPESIKNLLTKDQLRLYEIIWQRFVACQMENAIFEQNIVTITENDTVWSTTGEVKIFNGFLNVYKHDDNVKDVLLPKLEINEKINVEKIDPKQHFTEPPSRYTEASLIKVLEKNGIGRPSTYAPTISTIMQRGYVKLEDKKFYPETIGVTVIDTLEKYFPNIVNSQFTAEMEGKLDLIALGEAKWIEMIKNFYDPFIKTLKEAQETMPTQKEVKKSDKKCPQCESELVYRKSRFGEFLGCSNYPKCKYIEKNSNIPNKNDTLSQETKKTEEELEIEKNLEACPDCGSQLNLKQGRYGKFIGCSNYPKCKYLRNLKTENITKKCPECESELVVKFSKRGKFIGCSNYPNCKHIEKL